MQTFYIVRYHRKSAPKIVAFTHDKEKAQELCSHPKTRGLDWFYGWTESPPVRPSKAGYPSAGDLLKALPNNS